MRNSNADYNGVSGRMTGNGPDTGASRPDSCLTVWIRANARANWCYRPIPAVREMRILAWKLSFDTACTYRDAKRSIAQIFGLSGDD